MGDTKLYIISVEVPVTTVVMVTENLQSYPDKWEESKKKASVSRWRLARDIVRGAVQGDRTLGRD
jgi:hypothetical protein